MRLLAICTLIASQYLIQFSFQTAINLNLDNSEKRFSSLYNHII
ncbi:MAG: hypothetical protein ACI97H_001165 [Marinobacter psychrophilus]|jgi:hypothetical protein